MVHTELGHCLRSIKPSEKPSLGFPLTQHCLQGQTQPCRTGLVPPVQHTPTLHSQRAQCLQQAKVEGIPAQEVYWKEYLRLHLGEEMWSWCDD